MLTSLNRLLTSVLFKGLAVRQIFIRRLGSVMGNLSVSACPLLVFALLDLPCSPPHVIHTKFNLLWRSFMKLCELQAIWEANAHFTFMHKDFSLV